jgi:pimeloyl-ACP methyl ester carboxylesterase
MAEGARESRSRACKHRRRGPDRRRFPPPGRLVDVGGHRLDARCAGEGTPPVVIIVAMGGLAADWLAVQDAPAAESAVVVYDRAVLGRSDAVRRWPTGVGMAREVHALLDGAGITHSVVLAGHSSGRLVGRVFAWMDPGEVAGVIMTQDRIAAPSEARLRLEGSPAHHDADQAILCELAHDALHGPRGNAIVLGKLVGVRQLVSSVPLTRG